MNGVYIITNLINGKRYVGKAVHNTGKGIECRWRAYKRLLCKDQPRLYNALKKYGPENFKYEVALETNDNDNACRSEMYLIDVWNLQDDKYGYNINQGGERSTFGIKYQFRAKSEIHKKKISEAHKGMVMSVEARLKLSNSKIGKKTGMKHHNAKFKRIKNIVTGEIVEGCLSELSRIHNFSSSHISFRKKSKDWILLDG